MRIKPDETLVAEYISGSTNAFEILFDRYHKRIEFFFYKMLWGDNELASDYTQDLFLKIIENIESFNPDFKFKTWIFSMANNMCKNEYRKMEVRSHHHEKIMQTAFDKTENDGDKNYDNSQLMKEIHRLLDQETETKKAAFILKNIEELPIKQIAEILQTPEGTIKSGLHYTSKKLAEKLHHFKF